MDTANDIGAQYILAQDPDADRFSAGEKRFVLLNFYFFLICKLHSILVHWVNGLFLQRINLELFLQAKYSKNINHLVSLLTGWP